MSKKEEKIFLIFVEGSTDADCLDLIIEMYKENSNLSDITIRVQNGDIFTLRENDSKSGNNILKDQIKKFLQYSKLLVSQIAHVAFVTDTDGIYINPIDYIVDPNVNDFEYDLSNKKILCIDRDKCKSIQKSRQTKCKKITSVITNLNNSTLMVDRNEVKYSIHYNSINLEHVLFDKILPNEEKTEEVYKLLEDIDEDSNQLRKIFEKKALGEDYKDSWDNINKLEMDQGYTNLHILFQILDNFEK